jgi:hypothetical protein
VLVPRADGTATPIFGIDPGQPSYYDLSIGGRVNLWGDTVFLMGERHRAPERRRRAPDRHPALRDRSDLLSRS